MRPAEAEQTTESPPTSEVPAGAQYSVQLPTFEGPLDLLLHLCQKHELNILDIPIGFVTEKYLEYLAVMTLMNLDIASEYLVMAATLAHIKSKMLLPAPPPGQEDDFAAEEEDPRESLIRRLLEYQKYKQAGEELQSRGVAGRDVFTRGMPVEEAVHTGLPPLAQVPLFSLVEAFQNVLSKSKIKLSHDIVHERITLTDRINELVDMLRVRKRIQFEEMFDGLGTRFDLVITFLAILEMTKLRMTRLHQSEPMAPIYVEFSAQIEETTDDGGEEKKDAEPPAEESKTEEPVAAEEPNAEEPNAEEPNAEEPNAEEPNAEEPNAEEPNAEEPKSDEQDVGSNVSDTDPPPDMTHMTAPPPASERDPLETIPSPPLSEDEDHK